MNRLVVFVLIIGIVRQANGQTCSWSWTEPTSTSLTRSVGAPATFTASVNDVLDNLDLITWKIETEELSIEQYIQASTSFPSTSFNSLKEPRIVNTSFTPGGSSGNNAYTMSYLTATGVPQAHDGRDITVTSQGCAAQGTSPGITLNVKYCDLTFYGSDVTANDDSNCGYECERQFTCTANGATFQSTCQQDATWSETAERCAGAKEGALYGLVILSSIFSSFILLLG